MAFLIHFDGFGYGLISLGRILAVVAFLVIIYKLLVEKWRPPALQVRHWLPPLALITWGVVSGAWSSDVGNWIQGLGTFGLALAFFAVPAFLGGLRRQDRDVPAAPTGTAASSVR